MSDQTQLPPPKTPLAQRCIKTMGMIKSDLPETHTYAINSSNLSRRLLQHKQESVSLRNSPVVSRRTSGGEQISEMSFYNIGRDGESLTSTSCTSTPLMLRRRQLMAEYEDSRRSYDNSSPECSPLAVRRRTDFGSPVCGFPGVFASPARSIGRPADLEEDLVTETPARPEQTIISGWLKFRDNKRVGGSKFDKNHTDFSVGSLVYNIFFYVK